MNKEFLRHQKLQQRRQLSTEFRLGASRTIQEHLLNSSLLKRAQWVHVYLSLKEEVQTHALVEALWKQGVNVVTSRMTRGTHHLDHYLLSSWDELEEGPFHVQQPIANPKNRVHLDQIELFVVPGVVFSSGGARIGYGQGYYDRFLSEVNAYKVGLAFDIQRETFFAQESHDVLMDYIITEEGWFPKPPQ